MGKDNEPNIYEKTYKFMLPGDFIAFKLTGEINTTKNGLSEGICGILSIILQRV